MANPTDSPVDGKVQTLNQGEGDPMFSRVGPLLDGKTLKKKYLFGVPMKAAMTDEELTIEDLEGFITTAVGEFETSVRIPVAPVDAEDKFDFQRADDVQFSTRRLSRWPLLQVKNLAALWPGRPEGSEIDYPTEWVSADGESGLINIIPTSGSLNNADANFIFSMSGRSMTLGSMKQWPNLWRVRYRAGFDRDKVPHIVNHTIGVMASVAFLSQMGPAIFPVNSFAVGIDGLSQSTGNAGPQWLAQRMQELTMERDRLIQQCKSHFGTDLIFSVW